MQKLYVKLHPWIICAILLYTAILLLAYIIQCTYIGSKDVTKFNYSNVDVEDLAQRIIDVGKKIQVLWCQWYCDIVNFGKKKSWSEWSDKEGE